MDNGDGSIPPWKSNDVKVKLGNHYMKLCRLK